MFGIHQCSVKGWGIDMETVATTVQKDEDDSTSADARTQSDVCVAVASHKAYRMPDDAMYMPLHVGKAVHPDVDLGETFVTDNTGDNISDLNNYYSELTGLYWLWKNKHTPYKGLAHYRRHFETRNVATRLGKRDRFDKIVKHEEVRAALRDCDIIVPRHRNYVIETVYSHYAHTFDAHQLHEMRKILQEQQPDFVPAFDKVMRGTTAHMFNMMIMSDEKFDEYCAWLFPLLFELQKRIDPAQYDAFNARYPGRVSEMMLDVWLFTNGYAYKELPVISPEPVNWVKKGSAFLAAKFGGSKYSKSF